MDFNLGNHGKRAVSLAVTGAVLFALSCGVLVHAISNRSNQASTGSYQYTVAQNARASIHYTNSAYFSNNAPGVDNTAYVAALTDGITTNFQYNYSANRAVNLTGSYDIKAQLRSNYAVKGNTEDLSSVWTKDYQLVSKTPVETRDSALTITRSATIPYADYIAEAEKFRVSLALPTNSEVVVTFTITISGTVDGSAFTDTRTSTVSAPLGEQIFIPSVKFDKSDTKQILPQNAAQDHSRITVVELALGTLGLAAGLGLVAYGMRRRIFKSAHQRELDKIYRYHDGIIVRTSRPTDLSDHKVVPMRSFDDMLNLEEELKSPIIADEISSTMTHFMIAQGSVMYLFKLGTDDGTNTRLATNLVYQSTATKTAREALTPALHPELSHVHTYGLKPALGAPIATTPTPVARTAPAAKPADTPVKRTTSPAKPSSIDAIISDIGKKPNHHKK